MQDPTHCPQCNSEHVYTDGNLWICPECAHEWNPAASEGAGGGGGGKAEAEGLVVRDAHGNVLQDGDSVTIIKDLKVKGSSSVVKVGTKVRNIQLVDSADGHNISCRIDGFGHMGLKSEFVKKA